jgi:hypothetical protein
MNLLCSEAAGVNYIGTFLPIATFALSVAVACVAWAQWRIARNKLRLDLFDRRWQVYAATRTFVDGILNDPARDVDSA